MDDLKLIVEDKELNVKPTHGICSLPFLSYSLSQAYSENQPLTKKATPKSILNSCTNTLSSRSRGLISDVLQVYHFFRGDVGYRKTYDTTTEFTLKHLMYIQWMKLILEIPNFFWFITIENSFIRI